MEVTDVSIPRETVKYRNIDTNVRSGELISSFRGLFTRLDTDNGKFNTRTVARVRQPLTEEDVKDLEAEKRTSLVRAGVDIEISIPPPEEPAKKAKKESRDRTPLLEQLRDIVIPSMKSYEEQLSNVALKGLNPKRILSIDPGTTNIALCFVDIEKDLPNIGDGTITSKTEAPDHLAWQPSQVRYREHVIEQWIMMYKPDLIVKEAAVHGYANGAVDAGRIQYMIERLAMEYQIPVLTVGTSSMRSYIGASGKEHNKSDVKLKIYQKYRLEFNSEDETEAYALLVTGLAIIRGEYSVKGKK